MKIGRRFAKQLVVILLCVMLVLTCAPSAAFAAGKGDNGYNTTLYSSHKIDGNDLFVYVTGSGGTVERISGSDGDSVQQYRAVASDNWEFAYWSTYYNGPSTQNSNPTAALGYYYFSKPGDEDTAYTRTNSVIQVNEEMWAAGTFYLQAIFKPKVTVSVNRELPSSMQSIRGVSPATGLDNVFISGKTGYVPFGATVEVSLSAFRQDYVVESVTVHDGAPRSDFSYRIDTATNQLIVSFTATRPTNVQINVGFKEQVVLFDANGGSGSMTAQSFDSGVAKTLSANTFTKTGYTFNGWNTLANGSGTAYTDKQEVTFSPTNDGDSITLYAQWKQCTAHNWENDVCTECGLAHSHSYKYKADNNIITETCANGCAHRETATLMQENAVSTIYNGYTIKPLKVVYSPGWKGEKSATISYSNNITVGVATGSLTIEGQTATKNFTITAATPDALVPPTAQNSITYGAKLNEVALPDGWVWADGDLIPTVQGDGYIAYYTPADDYNFDWTSIEGWNDTEGRVERAVNLTVTPKELTVTWGNTNLVYDGTEKFPEFTVGGIIEGDDVGFTLSGKVADEGDNYTAKITDITGAHAANYKLPDNASTAFSVKSVAETPKTGDNSNLWLWSGILLICGGFLTAISLYKRKRKANTKK